MVMQHLELPESLLDEFLDCLVSLHHKPQRGELTRPVADEGVR